MLYKILYYYCITKLMFIISLYTNIFNLYQIKLNLSSLYYIIKHNKIQSLRKETDGRTSLIGFIGAPWTLVAYSVEGGHSKLCPNIKKMCLQDPVFAHSILEKYTEALCTYASYQVRTRLFYSVCLASTMHVHDVCFCFNKRLFQFFDYFILIIFLHNIFISMPNEVFVFFFHQHNIAFLILLRTYVLTFRLKVVLRFFKYLRVGLTISVKNNLYYSQR